ncbi:MAG: hypothetical protein R3E46_14710 [Sedimenticolaceae bacterium]
MRKRKMVSFVSRKPCSSCTRPLAWLGADDPVRTGIHVYAILPWLALVAMLVNVLSGMTGKFLLDRSRAASWRRKGTMPTRELPEDEVEKRLFWDATTFELMEEMACRCTCRSRSPSRCSASPV